MISFSAVFVRLAGVGPSTSAFYRMAFGGTLLLVVTLTMDRRLWPGWRVLGLAVLTGVFFSGDLFFWHRSILDVGPGLATILANFQVFFVTTYAVFMLKERPSWRYYTAIPLALVGLLLLVGTQWSEVGAQYKLGLAFGLITAQFYAAYVLTLRGVQSRASEPSSLAVITFSSFTTALISGVVALAVGENLAIPSVASVSWLVLYGVCGQVFGWVFITRSIRHLPASRVSLTLLLQPTLSFVWDMLFFDRPTHVVELIGAGIALAAIYLGNSRARRK